MRLPKANHEFWRDKFAANLRRDEAARAALEALGWKHATLWECAIRRDPDAVIAQIKELLRAPGGHAT